MHNRTKTITSASRPSLRVEPERRKAAGMVLQKGETLPAFIESSLRANIERRLNEKEFIARGLASRDRARQSNSITLLKNVRENSIPGAVFALCCMLAILSKFTQYNELKS